MQRHKKALVEVLVVSLCVLVFLGSLEECSQEEGQLTKKMELPCLDSMEIWTPRSWFGETEKKVFLYFKIVCPDGVQDRFVRMHELQDKKLVQIVHPCGILVQGNAKSSKTVRLCGDGYEKEKNLSTILLR